jgi:hypothetical protein
MGGCEEWYATKWMKVLNSSVLKLLPCKIISKGRDLLGAKIYPS